MLGVTGFGLIFTPVLYVTVRNLADWLQRRRAPERPTSTA